MKTEWLKNNWLKIVALVIFITAIGGAFYWYELRPAKIKHDCSWVFKHTDEVPAKPGKTQQEYDGCIEANQAKTGSYFEALLNSNCGEVARAYQPAKEWWQRATKAQYDFCIHEKGL